MEMKLIFKQAHKMTRNIVDTYGDVDYKVQFKLCLEYCMEIVKETEQENKMDEIKDVINPYVNYVRKINPYTFECKIHNKDVYFELINDNIKIASFIDRNNYEYETYYNQCHISDLSYMIDKLDYNLYHM